MIDHTKFFEAAEAIGYNRNQLKSLIQCQVGDPMRISNMVTYKAKSYVSANTETKCLRMEYATVEFKPTNPNIYYIEFAALAAYFLH